MKQLLSGAPVDRGYCELPAFGGRLPMNAGGSLEAGRSARVVERILLSDPDTLEIRSTITAPDVLTAPLQAVNRYRRARDRVFTEFDICMRGEKSGHA